MDRDDQAAARRRTFTWADPMALAAAVPDRDGLTFLREIADGTLPVPPVMAALGLAVEHVEPGRIVVALEPAEFHYNGIGSVHGGIYATVLDSACGCAVHSVLPAGVGYTSLDLSVKFLRPMTAGTGRVLATGEIVSAGRRTALSRAQLHDGAGKLLAEASSSCLILRD